MSHLNSIINNIKNMVHSEKYLKFLKHFEEGEKFFDLMRFSSAYLQYSEALKYNGSHPLCNYKKGLACLELEKAEEAEIFFSMAYKFDRSFFAAAFELGKIFYSTARIDEAVKIFAECSKIDSASEKARYMSGICLVLKGRLEKAEKEFVKGLRYSPEDPLCNTGLARLLFYHRGDNRGALKLLNLARKKNAEPGEADYLAAEIYLAGKNSVKLMAAAETFKKSRSKSIYMDLTLAAIALHNGALEQAGAIYKKALESKISRPHELLDALNAAGRLCRLTGEYNDGIKYYENVLKISGSDPQALSGLADIHIRSKNYHEALRVRDIAASAGQSLMNKVLGLYISANHYIDLRKTDEALSIIKEIDDILENFPRENSASLKKLAFKCLYLKGRAHFIKNEHTQAIRILEKITPERAAEIFEFEQEYSASLNDSQKILAAISSKTAEPEEAESISERGRRFYPLAENFYSAVKKASSIFKKKSEFAGLSAEAADMLEQFSKPLNLAVVGEFNTGKSTFINALIGEPVAPMGIEPVTATINIFSYGVEKRARVIYEDGVEEADINNLAAFIDERRLEEGAAQTIKFVEIFYPSEILKSVNIIDTPGLNAPLIEHEVLTKDFLRDADAILWLFDVQSAGKLTEKKSLEFISGFSRKTLAVVNKIDTVNEKETLEVVSALRDEFKNLIDNICPVSAKLALNGTVKKNAEYLFESNIDAMLDFLKSEIFSDSSNIKNASIIARFEQLMRRAFEIADASAANNEEALERAEAVFQKTKLKITSCRDNFNRNEASLIKNEYSKLAESFAERFREAVTIEKGVIFDDYRLDETDVEFFRKGIIKSVEDMLYSSIKNTALARIIKIDDDLTVELEEFLASSAPDEKNGFVMLLKGIIESQKKIFVDRVVRFNCKYFEGYVDGKLSALIAGGAQNRTSLGLPSRVIRELIPDLTEMLVINFDEWCAGHLQMLKQYIERLKDHFRAALASNQKTGAALAGLLNKKLDY